MDTKPNINRPSPAITGVSNKKRLNHYLEVADLVSDWYDHFQGKEQRPAKQFPKLRKALRAMEVARLWVEKKNLCLKDIKLVKSVLPVKDVVSTWLLTIHDPSPWGQDMRPCNTVGNNHILIIRQKE